tara:strand:+ start:83 stop:514 length:432 start_codon:yes stop_codon:yes gene_type:complete
MATTTATITLTSSDIADNSFSVSNTATLTTAGTDTGFTKTTGLTRVTTSATSNVVLLDSSATGGVQVAANATDIDKGKLFVQNLNDRGDGSKYVTVLLTAIEIGRLYGGDWMFIPWDGGDGNDVEITPSSTTDTTLEYMLFYQ